MSYLFTSESVSEGHPDKIADQISDAILDALLAQDPGSRVACETLVTTGQVVVAGEVTTKAYVEIQEIVRDTIRKIGYTSDAYQFDADSCGVLVALHSQSPDIAQGVNEGEGIDLDQGAGDQGMMFGYATRETDSYMPMALYYSHNLLRELARIRREESDKIGYLRPDSKAQVTIEYDDNDKPIRVHTVVISTQHDEFVNETTHPDLSKKEREDLMLGQIKEDMVNILIPRIIPNELLDQETIYHINPTGKFVIGGPHGDAGLTGRKIIVDTYGGRGAHGGGAFSGKDPSKVDRSAAYASRHVAKNLVAAGVAEEVLVQVSYAIGVARPVSVYVNTYGTSQLGISDAEIASKVNEIFDLRPKAITERFQLLNPIYSETAAYGHLGREPFEKEVPVNYVQVVEENGVKKEIRTQEMKNVQFFGWEKLDYVDQVKATFGI